MEKDNTFLAAVIMVVFILWNLLIAFGLWGGYPEGAFVKIGKLEAQVQIQTDQIEVLRNQINQKDLRIIPEHKKWGKDDKNL